ncbi:GNAT family N-acetyltransferase [Salipaludibacillus keqinensis]|uniref:GNAT family N-acetyltransferase n=1 Tax=Salipaludibacillus keqinensis TaxID=2045207 RepID=A0A323TIH9_9BACI|nr:GNAT family N-acetyltransferase [Salipaludibacillus keqinensis]PYZ94618.1 GNAT family N-acetyltransferase [Salipaludibacillus keqinensis]
MNIRKVSKSDLEQLKSLLETIDKESQFMLYEAGERMISTNQAETMIESLSGHSAFFVAEEDNQLVGYLIALGNKTNKTRHRAYLVLGVLKRFKGRGIGTELMDEAEDWAVQQGVTRLELTTMVHNEAALALYKKKGYEVEGLKRQSLMMNGEALDEYYLAKLLNNETEIG